MLQGVPERLDLKQEALEIKALIASQLALLVQEHQMHCVELDDPVIDLSFPVLVYPSKINSYNLDRNAVLKDELLGIKAQYLMFSQGVLNVRSFAGYGVHLDY